MRPMICPMYGMVVDTTGGSRGSAILVSLKEGQRVLRETNYRDRVL